MIKNISAIFCAGTLLLMAACSKDDAKPSTTPVGVTIEALTNQDTIMANVPAGKDSAVVISLTALLTQGSAIQDHRITFGVDTSYMVAYRAKHGKGNLLPMANYLFLRPICRIAAGDTRSDAAELNVIMQSSLKALTEYVLPLVITKIDGSAEGIAVGEVLYLIVKTGKSPIIEKAEWKILNFSSQATTGPASNLLDNNINTYWATSSYSYPQHVTINFGEEITFSGLTYTSPPSFVNYGGMPTTVKIEISSNGTSWQDKGTFTPVITAGVGTIDLGATTAKYLRFTVITGTPLYGVLQAVYLGDISLKP